MITLWIWLPYKERWTNGKYSATQEALNQYSFEKFQMIFYHYTGIVLCKDSFVFWYQKPEPEFKPLDVQEIITMLDSRKR